MAEIRLSRIKSSAFKISSYAGPSVSEAEIVPTFCTKTLKAYINITYILNLRHI